MLRLISFALSAIPLVWAEAYPNNGNTPGVGRLPAMGWNSWNAYHCDVDEDKVLQAADAIANNGFKQVGYEYVILDDCWSSGRDSNTNQIVPDAAKFPDGIDGMVSKIHALRLRSGIYSSAGTTTCGGYPGSLGYEQVDADTFASWGIDYLKYDNCGVPSSYNEKCYACNADPTFTTNLENGTCLYTSVQQGASQMMPICLPVWPVDGRDYSQSNTAKRFRLMGYWLLTQKNPILFSLCEWGTDEPWTWASTFAASWRMSNDVQPTWGDITRIINMNSFLGDFTDFGGRNDPDMLEVGNGDLTSQQTRSHFALWAIMKAPLIIGTDLTQLSQENVDILQNKYLIAFNQDNTYGKPATPYKWGINEDWTYNSTNPAEFWAGQSEQGTLVAMLNTLDTSRSMRLTYSEVPGLSSQAYNIVNAWTGEQIGCVVDGHYDVTVDAYDTAVLLLTSAC